MHFRISIDVQKIEFDAEQCSLRINGRNVTENEFIKMGQFHTIELEMNQKFKIEKSCWDAIHLERLDAACDPSKKADLAVVVMQEGLAHVCLLTSALTITKAKIERNMPKKNQVEICTSTQ
jgi:protein pelota